MNDFSSTFLPVIRPGLSFRRLRESRGWIIPFALLAAGHLLLLSLSDAAVARAVIAHLPSSATAGDQAGVRAMLENDLLPRALLLPVRLLAGWSAFTMLLWFLLRSTRPGQPVGFGLLFQLELRAELVLLLGSFAALFLSPEAGDPARTAPFWSLAHYVSGVSMPAFILLRALDFFTLWYAALLAAGIHVLSNQSIRTSASVAAGACVLTTLFDAGVISLLIEQFHLLV
jgi:hypothetical protein